MRRFRYNLALIVLALPFAAAAQTLPVKDFVRHPEFKSISLSPDGTYLAAISSPKNKPELYSLAFFKLKSILSGHPKIISHFTLRDYKIFGNIYWVSNKRVAFSTETQIGGFNQPYLTGSLYAMDADGANFVKLMPWNNGYFFGGVLSLLPKRPNYMLIQAYTEGFPQAYLINTEGSRISNSHGENAYHYKRAQSPGNAGMLADNSGNIRVAFGTNELTGELESFYRANDSMDWEEDSKAFVTRVDTHGISFPQVLHFTKNNKKLYIAAYVDNKNQTRGLFLFDPDTEKQKLIYANTAADVGGSDYADYGTEIYSYDKKQLVGIRIMPDKPVTLAIKPNSQKMQDLAALAQTFPHKQVRITGATRDGSDSIVKVWSDTDPGVFYLFSHKPKPSLTALFRAEPWIKPEQMSLMRPITFKARDGVTLHGYLTIPKKSNGKKLPMLVMVHGGPYGIRDHWGFNPEVQLLANRGYAVLQINYRGSGGYGNKLKVLGIQHWGDTMQDDLADGTRWAIKQGVANPHRICIYGGSYGGYSALMSAERFPNLYQCAIGYSGVYDLFVIKSRKSDTARSASGRLYLREVLGNNDAQLKKFSPVYQVDSLKAPVLLMHGGRDERAPPKGYTEMIDAIKKHGTPLETLYFSNEGHGFYKVAHRVKAYDKILAFLGKYIGPDSKAVASTQH